jgi:hypothetical protein
MFRSIEMSIELKRIRTRTRATDKTYGWAVVGPHGAIEFWFTDRGQGADYYRYLGGVETHQRKPFEYSSDKEAPDHDKCDVLSGPCWYDGTSLWAMEYWIPEVLRYDNWQEAEELFVFPTLERTYKGRWVDEH